MKKSLIILLMLSLTPVALAAETAADMTGSQIQVSNRTSNKELEKQLRIMERTLEKKGLDVETRNSARNEMRRLCENEGYTPHQARNIVSETALECHRQGITGTELAHRVHEAIQQRKQDRVMLREGKGTGEGNGAEIREQKRTQNRKGEGQGGARTGAGNGSGQDGQGGQDTGNGNNRKGK